MDNDKIKVRMPDLSNSSVKFGGYRDLTIEEKEAISMQPRTELVVAVTPAQKMEAMRLVLEMEKVRPKMIPYIKVDDLWEEAKQILNIIYT